MLGAARIGSGILENTKQPTAGVGAVKTGPSASREQQGLADEILGILGLRGQPPSHPVENRELGLNDGFELGQPFLRLLMRARAPSPMMAMVVGSGTL